MVYYFAFVIVRRCIFNVLLVAAFVVHIQLIRAHHRAQYYEHRLGIIAYFVMVLFFVTYNLIFVDIFSYFEQEANNADKLKDIYYQNRAYYLYE